MPDYRLQLNEKLKSAQKRVSLGVAAKQIGDNATALFALIDEEISVLLNEVAGDKPLPQEEYLNKHGRIQGLKKVRQMVSYRDQDHANAQKEVDTIRAQIKEFDASQPQQ